MTDIEHIYREHAQTVYKFLLYQSRNAVLAEELTQETFYQAVKSIGRFDGSCKISVWLCQIAKHLWYQYLEKHKREAPVKDLPENAIAFSAEEAVLNRELHLDLLKQIHDLQPLAREVFYLRVLGDLSFREIGDVLGKTENWARVTFYRSKKNLKEELRMKAELPCAVVRDLLPSYVEKLTEEETTAAVRSHLDKCRNCRMRYESMAAGDEIQQADAKEVDYLKTVRKKNRKRVIVAAAAAVVLVLSSVFAQLFLIGTAAGYDSVAAQVTPSTEFEAISVSFCNLDSAKVLTDIKIQTTDGVIDITARKVLVSPIHPAEEVSVSINLSGIREVRAFGESIWRDNIVIEGYTHRLIRNKTEFVGNAPAVSKLIGSMDLDAPHSLELHTDQEPYGVTIHFTDAIRENRRFMIRGSACVLLSLVDNLSEVYWDDPSGYSDSVTLTDAESMLSESIDIYNQAHGTQLDTLGSIKDYGADAYQLQVLRNILGV